MSELFLTLQRLVHILRAVKNEESRPIWGFDMRKSLYVNGLIQIDQPNTSTR